MNETIINDVVAQEALDQLEELDNAMVATLKQFENVGKELAKGLKIPVEVTGDLDKLKQVYETQMQRAGQATQQLTNIQRQQAQVIANTTNTISRQLQEQEKLNKAQREAFTQNQRALDVADQVLGSREDNYRMMAKYTAEMKNLKEAMKRLDQDEKNNLVTTEQAVQRRASLMAEYDKVKAASQELSRILSVENKEANAASGSYQQLSQQLERLKQAQKQMNESEKASAAGKALEAEIQNLDARLKDLAADMGEYQRNVGNYAIAGESMRSHLKELTETIARLTMEYEAMDESEKKEAKGQELKNKIIELTEEAGRFKDTISDVKQSIGNSASDTRWLNTMTQAGQMLQSSFALCKSSAEALGLSEDALAQATMKVQLAMHTVNAMTILQNALQKQSNVMKGIGVIQSKAMAAAQRIEAAAANQATGATIAQTVAMKAFNAVAKANPYVLLATAILAVIGLIVGYTTATKDATAADEEAKKAADQRRESMDNMAQSFGQSAGETIAKYKLLREQWNALGDDINAKRQYLLQHKSDFDSVSEAADGAGASVKTVADAEKLMQDNTGKVEAAIKRRAQAMAGYAEYIRLTQLELQELEKLSTFTYRTYKAGDMANLDDFFKAGLKMNDEQINVRKYAGPSSNMIYLTAEQAAKMTSYSKQIGNAEALESIAKVEEKYDKMREAAWKRFVDNGGLDPASFRGGSGGSGGGKSTKPGKGNDKPEAVKTAEEIKDEVDAIILQAIKGQADNAKEYTDEWINLQKEAINKQAEADKAAADDKYDKTLADLEKTHKAGKISEEEYQEQLKYLYNATAQVKKNIDEKAAEDIKAIDEDVLAHKQELAEQELELIEHKTEMELSSITISNAKKLNELRVLYLEELRQNVGNEEKVAEIKKRYAKESADLATQNAIDVAKASVEGLEKALKLEDLSDEDRERIAKELAEAKIAYAKAVGDAEESQLERTIEDEKDARDKRMKNIQDWAQKAAEAIGNVSDLLSAMYDNQISKIEEQMDAESAHHEAQIAQIDELEEHGAITKEEAELRKREAEAKTAAKQEALEKKKAQLEYKRAVAEKANSISQIAIATALGIMKASPNWVMMALVGAMGAIQIATALAQPIRAYKEGTKGKPHPGGLAVVGDGGQAELVAYGRRVWVTPDTPTLVDLPKGAEVFPQVTEDDLAMLGASLPMAIPRDKSSGMPVIINDYSALESRIAANTKAVTKALSRHEKALTRELKNQRFAAYLARRL